MPSAAERSIATPRLCTEIIEDFLPRMAHSERTHLRIAVHTGSAQPQVTDMRAHLEATRGRPTASPAAIAGQAVNRGAEGNRAYAGNRGFSGGERAFSGRESSAPRAGGFSGSRGRESRGFSSHGGSGGSHGSGHSSGGHAAVDTAAVEVTVAADAAASAKCHSRHRSSPKSKAPLSRAGFLSRTIWVVAASICSVILRQESEIPLREKKQSSR